MEKLEEYPPDILNKQPAPGQWSVVQIMQHLTYAEKGSARYIKYKLENEKRLKKSGVNAWFRSFILDIIMVLPIRIKAPAILPPPENSLHFTEARNEWNAGRKSLKSVLDSMNTAQINSALFKHPIVGKMNIKQALRFMQQHFERHEKQIFRVLDAVK